jgi:propionyl-CoA carboxylase beta chain
MGKEWFANLRGGHYRKIRYAMTKLKKILFANPYKSAELGYIDEIILPEQTRIKLIQALDMAKNKMKTNSPKKHGNIPL